MDFLNYQVKLADTPQAREEIFRLRYDVYCHDYGYLDPSECPTEIETDPWDETAYQFAVCAPDERIVGTARLIVDSPLGFQSETYGAFPTVPRDLLTEQSRFAFHHDIRGQGFGFVNEIAKEMYHFTLGIGKRYWFCAMVLQTWKLMLKIGLYYKIIGDPVIWSRAANDSVVLVPALCDLHAAPQYLSHASPRNYEYFFADKPAPEHDAGAIEELLTCVERDKQRMREITRAAMAPRRELVAA